MPELPTTAGTFSPAVFRREVAGRGLTLRELARLCGIHEVSVYRYAEGHTQPSPRSLTKLSIALARVPRLPVDLAGSA